MDDFKRSIYMEARRMIEEGEQDFVCCALQSAMRDITGLALEDGGVEGNAILAELFPEFFYLHDGVYWSLYRGPAGEEMFYRARQLCKHSAWWAFDWVEPRLAILDFILNSNRQGVKNVVCMSGFVLQSSTSSSTTDRRFQ